MIGQSKVEEITKGENYQSKILRKKDGDNNKTWGRAGSDIYCSRNEGDTWTREYIRLIPRSRTVLRRSMHLNSLNSPNNP